MKTTLLKKKKMKKILQQSGAKAERGAGKRLARELNDVDIDGTPLVDFG